MKILLAVDATEPSKTALDAVQNMTWPPGSTLRVLSVTRDVSPLFASSRFAPAWAAGNAAAVQPTATRVEHPGQSYQELDDRMKLETESVVRRVAELLRDKAELTIETVVRTGDARDVIVDEATEWHADLIVVGSHGRTGVQRWFLGSVAEAVVRHAPCSVQVARPARGSSSEH
jgi:nucleotide-binding universal stress UspA family protein